MAFSTSNGKSSKIYIHVLYIGRHLFSKGDGGTYAIYFTWLVVFVTNFATASNMHMTQSLSNAKFLGNLDQCFRYIETLIIQPRLAHQSSDCIGGGGFTVDVSAATGVCQETELAPLVNKIYCSSIYCLYCFLN